MPSIISATTTTGLVSSADNSGSLQLATNNGTTAVTIDTSQNVGIGTTSPTGKLEVSGGQLRVTASGASSMFLVNPSTTYADGVDIQATYNGAGSFGPLKFTTSGSERMRIDSAGRVGINSVPAAWIGNEQLTVKGSSPADQYVATISQGNASPSAGCCLFLNYTGAAPNNTTAQFLQCNDNTGVSKLVIYSNGTVSNRTGTYNSLSDAKIKENIVDATPKLDKLMQTKVRNYNLIGDNLKQIGFVAQELEQVFPNLVDEVPDFDENRKPTGETTKMVKTSVMIPILVKAMQEQQAMIQELKAELDATKAEVAALKGA